MPEKHNSIDEQTRKLPGPEELSALVDGEIPGDCEAVLDSASLDGECRATWHRYHIIRDVIQRDYCPVVCTGMVENISRRISAEDAGPDTAGNVVAIGQRSSDQAGPSRTDSNSSHAFSREKPQRRAWLPVAGLGLAASVAAAGFMAWQVNGTGNSVRGPENTVSIDTQQIGQPVNGADNNAPIIVATAAVPAGNSAAPGTRWLVSTATPRDQQVEQRLNSLLLNHLEDSTMGRVQGMLTHSRVVAYDSVPVNDRF